MDENETVEYMQLLNVAFELLLEKKECMTYMLQGTAGKKRKACLKRVEELDVLLEENSQQLKSFDHLKKTIIQELH